MDKDVKSISENTSKQIFQYYNEIKHFFYLLALLSFVSALMLAGIRSYISGEIFKTGNAFKDIFVSRMIECGWKVVVFVPLLILICVYRKKLSQCDEFSLIAYMLVICYTVMPTVATVVCSSYEIADLLLVFTASLCMFYVGVKTNSKRLKICACVFIAIPMIPTALISFIDMYSQCNNTVPFTSTAVTVIIIFKSLRDIIFPSVGYLIISLHMKKLV